MTWLNLDKDAPNSRSPHWIFILTEVLLCHFVNMFFCSVEGYFPDTPANYGHVVLAFRVDDSERYPWIPGHISVLLASFEGIDQDGVTIMVYPRLRDLRRSIGHQRRHVRKSPRFDEVLHGIWKRFHFPLCQKKGDDRLVKILIVCQAYFAADNAYGP